MKFCQNLLASLAYSAQSIRPPPKLTHKRHIHGMLTRPTNDSHCLKLCHLNCSLITNTASKVSNFSCFGTCKIPCAEIRKLLPVYACGHDLFLLFQKRSKLVHYKWPKVRIVLVTKNKTRFGILRCNPWGNFPLFFV